jgi:hypothetical protein
MASGKLPSVADRPHTTSAGFQRLSRASASCTCTPRLLASSSCHSSTTTACTWPNSVRAASRLISRLRLSGVVTSTLGKRRSCRALSLLAVSPVRRPSVSGKPSSSIGSRSALAVSAARARIGVTQMTDSGSVALESAARLFINRSSRPSHTACVLPEPVVACSRPLRPCAIAAQASR